MLFSASTTWKIIKCIYIVSFGAGVFLLPYYYENRLTTGIFKTDFYLFWFIGSIAGLRQMLHQKLKIDQFNFIALVFIVYLLWAALFRQPDENTLYFILTFISCICIINYLTLALRNKNYSWIFLGILILCFSQQVLAGLSQILSGDTHAESIKGNLFNSGFYSNYLASMIPFIISGIIFRSVLPVAIRILFSVLLLASVCLVVYTLARAAIIGCVVGGIIVFTLRLNITFPRRQWCTFLIFGVLAMVAFLYSFKPASFRGRMTIYRVTFDLIRDHLITGVGANRFSAVYNNYQAKYFGSHNTSIEIQLLASNVYEAFNSVLQIFAEYGLIGFLIVLYAVISFVRINGTNKKLLLKQWQNAGSIASLVGIFVSSLFSNPVHVIPILFVVCYHSAQIRAVNPDAFCCMYLPGRKFVSIPLGLVLCVGYLATLHFFAESTWHRASKLAKYNSPKNALLLYKKAERMLKYNGDFLFNFGSEAILHGRTALGIEVLEQAKLLSSHSNLYEFLGDGYADSQTTTIAEQHYLHASHIVPHLLYPKYRLIKLYKMKGQTKLYDSLLLRTITYPVKVPSEYTSSLLYELQTEMIRDAPAVKNVN